VHELNLEQRYHEMGWSFDERYFAILQSDPDTNLVTVAIYDTTTWEIVARLTDPNPDERIKIMAWHSQESVIATGNWQGEVYFWTADEWEPVLQFQVQSMVFSSDTGFPVHEPPTEDIDYPVLAGSLIYVFDWSFDGAFLAVISEIGHGTGNIHIFDTRFKQRQVLQSFSRGGLSWSPDQNYFVNCLGNRATVYSYTSAGDMFPEQIITLQDPRVAGWSSDGVFFALIDRPDKLQFWSVRSYEIVAEFAIDAGVSIHQIEWHGEHLYIGLEEGIHVYRVEGLQ
jgi:WD40 repeat protein